MTQHAAVPQSHPAADTAGPSSEKTFMTANGPMLRRLPRRSRLTTYLVAALALGASGLDAAMPASAQPLGGTTHVVANCDDQGAGSLRDVVGLALSGDTIDLTTLGCSTITLTSGEILTPLNDLTLIGPETSTLTLESGGASRILAHTGTGQLSVDALAIRNGTARSTVRITPSAAASSPRARSSSRTRRAVASLRQTSWSPATAHWKATPQTSGPANTALTPVPQAWAATR